MKELFMKKCGIPEHEIPDDQYMVKSASRRARRRRDLGYRPPTANQNPEPKAQDPTPRPTIQIHWARMRKGEGMPCPPKAPNALGLEIKPGPTLTWRFCLKNLNISKV